MTLVTSNAPQHLAILTPTFGRGGSEEYVIAMAEWGLRQYRSVTVCLPDMPEVASVRRDLTERGVQVEPIVAGPETWFSRDLFLASHAPALRLFRARQFDRLVIVLPTLQWGGAFIDAAAQADIPTAVVYQLVAGFHPFSSHEKTFYTWARRQRQMWTTVSAQNRDMLCASLGWAPDAVDVLPNGLLRPLTPATPAERTSARASVTHEIGVDPQAFIVVTVARLHGQKAFDVLVDAAAALAVSYPHVHFVWVGDGDEQPAAAALLSARQLNDRVHLVGRSTDVPRYLQAADAFVLPSRFEGSPFAAIEALAMGLPTVLSDIGPHRELARDGVEALFVPVEDSALLAERIARLSADDELRARLSRGARQRAQDFAPTTSFRRLFDRLEQAASGVPVRRSLWPLPGSVAPAKRIAIYGTGLGGRRAYLERMPDVEVVAFLDSAPRQADLFGVPILPPAAVQTLDVSRVVVASHDHWPAMVETLRTASYPEENIEVFDALRMDLREGLEDR